MSVFRTAAVLMTVVVLVGAPGSVFAQRMTTTAAPNAPTEKTIGMPSTGRREGRAVADRDECRGRDT